LYLCHASWSSRPPHPPTLLSTLSLHDALPICEGALVRVVLPDLVGQPHGGGVAARQVGQAGGRAGVAPEPLGAADLAGRYAAARSEEHTSELQSHLNLVCRLLLEKKKIDN